MIIIFMIIIIIVTIIVVIVIIMIIIMILLWLLSWPILLYIYIYICVSRYSIIHIPWRPYFQWLDLPLAGNIPSYILCWFHMAMNNWQSQLIIHKT